MKLLVLQYAAVAAAGAVGAAARLLVGQLSRLVFPHDAFVGTMIINLTGTLFVGWFGTWAAVRMVASPVLRMAIGVGFVGAYTTFSTWMFETNDLASKGHFAKAAFNLLASVLLGLAAVRLGVHFAKR